MIDTGSADIESNKIKDALLELNKEIEVIKKELDGVELLTKKTFSGSGGEGFDAKLEKLGRKQILVTGLIPTIFRGKQIKLHIAA